MENAPQCSDPAPHGFIQARLMGKIFPIMFSNIINNDIHYSHLLSIYSKVFRYLLKSLQRSYSFTQHVFIEFLLGGRQNSKHLRQIRGQCRQKSKSSWQGHNMQLTLHNSRGRHTQWLFCDLGALASDSLATPLCGAPILVEVIEYQ